MSQAWKSAPVAGTELLMLLALADMANDDMECWPRIAHLAAKTRLSDRQVTRLISKMVKDRIIVRVTKSGRGRKGEESNLYRITPETWSNSDADVTTPGVMDVTTCSDADVTTPGVMDVTTMKRHQESLKEPPSSIADHPFSEKPYTEKPEADEGKKPLTEKPYTENPHITEYRGVQGNENEKHDTESRAKTRKAKSAPKTVAQQWNESPPIAEMGTTLLRLFGWDGTVDVDHMPTAAIEPFFNVAMELNRAGLSPEDAEKLHAYVVARAKKENWTYKPSVTTLPKYFVQWKSYQTKRDNNLPIPFAERVFPGDEIARAAA